MNFSDIHSNTRLFLHTRAKVLWGVSVVLFITHQVLQLALSIYIHWMDNWLDPLLFPIIVMPLLRWEREIFTGNKPYIFSIFETMVITIGLILVSELLFPFLSERFTTDPIDMVTILIGGLIFHKFMQ